ncbi:MAG TPA: hypothetical protein VF076_03740, partial [Acidimicrobiales bacterium]
MSFSGQTSETLAGATAALERGAPVVSVSAGGALAALVEGAGGVTLGLDVAIPMPRAALGALVAPVVAVAEDVGVLPGARAQVAAAVDQLHRRAELLARPGS